MKGYYSQASKLASKIYNLFMETFADIPCVVYCVGTERWQDHVNVEVWATIGNGKASDDLRELVGNFTKTFSFASYRSENTADFFARIQNEIQPFARKAKNVQEIVNNDKQ